MSRKTSYFQGISNGSPPKDIPSSESPLKDLADYATISLEDVGMLYRQIEMQTVLSKYNFPAKASSDGRWKIYVKDTTAREGRRKLAARSLEALKQKVYEHERGIAGRTRKTFNDGFELVQAEKLKYIKDPEKRLSVENSIKRNRSEYKRFFSGTAFEKRFIDEITSQDLDDLCIMNLNRYEMGRKAFLSLRSILKSVFDLAYQQHWIDDNPYLRLNPKKYKDMFIKPASIELRCHSAEEIRMMLEAIREHQKKYPHYVGTYALEFQIATAMRRGEIPPLTWSDIVEDSEYGFIRITKEQITVKSDKPGYPEKFVIVHHTKTYKDRRFPITREVRVCLEKIQMLHDTYYPESTFLFPAENDNGCITNNVVYQLYRRICRKLGIKLSREFIKGTHSFRRNAISKVANASNGGLAMAAELYGNSPQVAYGNYYTGVNLESAKNVLDA